MQRLRITLCLLLITGVCLAQDIQFTQFYAAPLYLNPAFAGANVCSRLCTSYRNQWPGINKTFVSYAASYDHSIPSLSSGIGFLFTNDKAGSGNLKTTSFSALYSYEALLSRTWSARVGVQAGGVLRDVDFYKLVFGDQIARGNSASSVEIAPSSRIFYFDVSTGILLYSYKYWFGFSAHHLTQPNQSLIGGESILPVDYSVHSGINLPVGSDSESSGKKIKKMRSSKNLVSPAINYRHQGKFDQVDLGVYYTHSPMVLGLWYRGIPIMRSYSTNNINHDAFAITAGFEIESFKFGYSYDMTLSRLASATGGAHEITMAYQFCDYAAMKRQTKKKKWPLIIPCAKF